MNIEKYYFNKMKLRDNGVITIDEWLNFCFVLTCIIMKKNKKVLENLKYA